jgi:hypothetical protein
MNKLACLIVLLALAACQEDTTAAAPCQAIQWGRDANGKLVEVGKVPCAEGPVEKWVRDKDGKPMRVYQGTSDHNSL